MFNGIIYKTGIVKSLKKSKDNIFLGIQSDIKFHKKNIGDSVCCDGVCLTIVKVFKNMIYFYISYETLKRSNFNLIKINQEINLEKSLIYGQNISGHFTQGHVDTVAKLIKINLIDKSWVIKFKILNKNLNKYLMSKGSISINGVSLTISKVYQNFFEVNVIPHTLKLTNLKNLKHDSLVNVELDILSKYIYKYSN